MPIWVVPYQLKIMNLRLIGDWRGVFWQTLIRSYFEKKPRSRKKSKKVKKRIKLLQYDKKFICQEKITPLG